MNQCFFSFFRILGEKFKKYVFVRFALFFGAFLDDYKARIIS